MSHLKAVFPCSAKSLEAEQRLSVTSAKTFENVVAAVKAAVGRPEMCEFEEKIAAARTTIWRAASASEIRTDGVYPLRHGHSSRKSARIRGAEEYRFVVGNPLIMQAMAQHVPDAASYAPVTVLIDERPGGVQLSYDTMASLLAPYGNAEALRVAQELDEKVGQLIAEAAGS